MKWLKGTKELQDLSWLGGKGDLLGIVETFKFDQAEKCYMYKQESDLDNKKHRIHWDLDKQTVTQSWPEASTLQEKISN